MLNLFSEVANVGLDNGKGELDEAGNPSRCGGTLRLFSGDRREPVFPFLFFSPSGLSLAN